MTMAKKRRDIFIYADWQEVQGPLLMGVLHADHLKGREVYSFEYEKEWLKSGRAQLLDPDLQLFSGVQYLADESKTNFGLFLDSSPDRWGRILMRRREAALARLEQRQERSLYETDYLLGVNDLHRMGGLRFKLEPNGSFLDDKKDMPTPPWTSIRELEQISLKLEEESAIDDPDYLNWINFLLAPGSSLGGARPKASVLDTEGHLWIAKFPSTLDKDNTGAWEMVAYQLAKNSGISMAPSEARRFSSDHFTFLTKRFDRSSTGRRVHFASAMTCLGYVDGNDHLDGISYLDLAEFISTRGARPKEDLEELWKRIVFSICVSNTDDHLRNHGFLLTGNGWILSPAFDINPVETGNGLKLNISENDNSLDLNLAMEVCPYFRIKESQASSILNEIKLRVQDWRKVATQLGIKRDAQELKGNAFRNADA